MHILIRTCGENGYEFDSASHISSKRKCTVLSLEKKPEILDRVINESAVALSKEKPSFWPLECRKSEEQTFPFSVGGFQLRI